MSVSNEMREHLQGTSSLAIFIKIIAKDGDVIAVTNTTQNKIIEELNTRLFRYSRPSSSLPRDYKQIILNW